MKILSIAIDGPSGSGKSTIARELAKVLDIIYLDTGAMYRAVGYYLDKTGVDVGDEKEVIKNLDSIKMEIKYSSDSQRVLVNDEDVTDYIRDVHVTKLSSIVARIKAVRDKLVDIQRKMAEKISVVLDGRDIGSHVLPNADYKFYLTASIDVRVKRRYLELKDKEKVTLQQVKKDMILRDEQDFTRDQSPLVIAKGAFVVDTTNLNIQEVLDVILSKIKRG